MKEFWAFVKIEFFHIFRDRRTMLILLGMPVLQIMLFGFAITTEINHSRVAVLDPSRDAVTTRITQRIDGNRYFSVVKRLDASSDMETVFRRDEADVVVAFTPRFDENLQTGEAGIQLVVDATDPNTASMTSGYVQGIIGQALQEGRTPAVDIQTHLLFNPQMKSAYNFVPGVMGLILMLICAMMTAISIVREKETGTMEVLLASPMKPMHIMLSKMLPYFTLSVVNVVTVLLLAVFVMGVPIRGSLFWLAVSSVVFIFVALALGLLISTLVSRQMSALLVSGIGLMMPTIVFSGLIFPLESMPEGLRWISDFVPARWYIAIMRKIMIEGVGVAYFVKELGVIVLMAAVLMAAAWKNFKVRLV